MSRTRRFVTQVLAAVLAFPALSSADTFPDKPVKLVVPTAIGGANDNVARVVGQGLSTRWKQPVVVENRPGAGGAIGAAQVAKAPGDGHTLAVVSTGFTSLSSMQRNLTFNPAKDLAPVGMVGSVPYALLVRIDAPYRSVAELIEYAKKSPGQLNYGSGGTGTLTHLFAAWFKSEAGLDMVHIPYAGAGPALQALLAGQVAIYFDPISTSAELVKAGKLRALATTAPSRFVPGVPTLTEAGIPVRGAVWFGVLAPAATPRDIVERINGDLGAVLAEPAVRQILGGTGLEVQPMTVAEFGSYVASETATWGAVIRRNSITAD